MSQDKPEELRLDHKFTNAAAGTRLEMKTWFAIVLVAAVAAQAAAGGVTRERVRQIEARTMAKLRHPHRSQTLREYLDEG